MSNLPIKNKRHSVPLEIKFLVISFINVYKTLLTNYDVINEKNCCSFDCE